MTALRLLVIGLGLLLLALLLVADLVVDPAAVSGVRTWAVQVLTLVGAGLVVSAGLVSALTPRPAPAPEPATDHYAA